MLIILHLYLPPLLTAERGGSLFTTWKSALFTGIALLPRSMLMLLTVLLPLLCYIYLPNVFWSISFFWVFFWPAIIARIFLALIRRFFPEFDRPDDAEPDPAE